MTNEKILNSFIKADIDLLNSFLITSQGLYAEKKRIIVFNEDNSQYVFINYKLFKKWFEYIEKIKDDSIFEDSDFINYFKDFRHEIGDELINEMNIMGWLNIFVGIKSSNLLYSLLISLMVY